MINAAGTVARIVTNWLADRYGPYTVIVPTVTLLGGTIWGMFGV